MSDRSTLVVRHATPLRNVKSILRSGLLPSLARGKLKVVWLHTAYRTKWAVPHVAWRHNCAVEQVAFLTLELPRSFLKRNRRGVWTCNRVIPPGFIVSIRHPLMGFEPKAA